jgi:hypothetical protein
MDVTLRMNLGGFMFGMGRLRSADFTEVLDDEADAYLSLMQDRYVTQSRGGWLPLAPFTNAQRVRLGFPPVQPILIRDGTLFGALVKGNAGNVWERGQDRLTVGIGGGAVHPGYGEGGRHPTIGEIAFWQHFGTSKIPPREILVLPEGLGINAIRQAAEMALAARIIERITAGAMTGGGALRPGIAASP